MCQVEHKVKGVFEYASHQIPQDKTPLKAQPKSTATKIFQMQVQTNVTDYTGSLIWI